MNDRKIKLRGAKNARDLGGIKTLDGRVIKKNRLIRCNDLSRLTKNDIKILTTEHQLKAVIDLRTATERSESPDAVMMGVRSLHIPVFSEQTMGVTHEENIDKREMINHLPDLCALYATMASDEFCKKELASSLHEIINTTDGAILWHCTEGKDRCGVLSALVLAMLNVSRDDIFDDYLLTNDAASANATKYYFLVTVFMRRPDKAKEIRRLFSAERDFLEAFYKTAEGESGTMEGYIREALGVTDNEIAAFRESVLE